MTLAPMARIQFKNVVERVLHVPGNYRGGTLEMAIVFDSVLDKSHVLQLGKDIADLLKSQSEIFRNVRLNTIRWISDDRIEKEISSMPFLQMGRYFDSYEQIENEKRADILAGQLKKFYARSKLILLVTDGNYLLGDRERLKSNLRPFLYKKLVIIRISANKPEGMADTKEAAIYSGAELLNGMAASEAVIDERNPDTER